MLKCIYNKSMKIQIVVDKRTEVMEVLQKLTNYFMRYSFLNVNFDVPYIKDVENYFTKYKNHKAVKLMQQCIDNLDFSYSTPIALALRLNKDFSFDENKFVGNSYEDRYNSDKRVRALLLEIKNFVIDTKFEEFYNSHKKQYNAWLKDVRRVVDDGLIDYLNTFHKQNLKRKYVINLLPMQTNANYGIAVGKISVCNLGIKVDGNNYCYFIKPGLAWLLHHEFSHPIINPLTDKYFDYNKMPKLPESVWKVLKNSAYGDYETYAKEQVVRAADILYAKHVWGRKISEEERISKTEMSGFVHTRRILKALKNYRKQTLPMSSYYPKIIQEFYKPLTEDELKYFEERK